MVKLCLFLTFLLSFSLSCKPRNTKSKTKIDDGFLVVEAGGYMPGVVGIGIKSSSKDFEILCSATAVSDSSLLTAAHCVTFRSQDQEATSSGNLSKSPHEVCVSLPTQDGDQIRCNGDAYFPKKYYDAAASSGINYDFDIAVIVFPKNTFKYIHNIDLDESPKAGGEGIIVGFSKEQLQVGELSKRWGRARIVEKDTLGKASREAEITSEKLRSSTEEQAVSPGDSGGPMLSSQCKVTGVASRMAIGKDKNSIHTRVKVASSIEFLKLAEEQLNTSICGLSRVCDGDSVVKQIAVDGRSKFPCRATSEGTDPVLISAMKRAQDLNNQLKQSNTELVACKDTGSVHQKAGYAAQCLESTLRDSLNKNKDCSSNDIHVNGLKAVVSKPLDLDVGIPLAPDTWAFGDQATSSPSYLDKETRNKLVCANQGSPKANQCCFEVSCRQLSRSDGRTVIGEPVKCNREIEPNEFIRTARYSGSKLTVRVIPNQIDLESLPFSCENLQGMSWRSTFGVCWENLRKIDHPVDANTNSAAQVEGKDFVCWRVEKGAKTSTKRPCPESVKKILSSYSPGI